MRILRLTIQNLNSLRMEEPAVVDFSTAPLAESGIFAITGDTGAGKTTILDALTLGLYGRIHRNKEVREVLSYGATFCLAEVEFETAEGVYRAKWGLWRANNRLEGKLQPPKRELARKNPKTGEFEVIAEKIRDVDLKVEEISGLDYDRFTRSVLLSQGDFAAFLKADARDRSDLLERITGTEMYSKLSIAAYERHKLEQLVLEQLQQEKEGLQLLDPELLSSLEKELKLKEKESKKAKKEQDEKRTIIQQLQQKISFETQQQQLEQRAIALEEEEKVHAEDFKRLLQHQNAQIFQLPFAALENEQVLFQKTEEEKHSLETQYKDLAASQKDYKKACKEEEKQMLLWQKAFPIEKQKIEKAKKIDIQLAERQAPLVKRLQEFEQAQKNASGLAEQLTLIQKEEIAGEKTLADLEKWLSKHANLKGLAEDLPFVNVKRKELRDLIRQQKLLENEIKGLQTELKSLTKKAADKKEETAAHKTKLQTLSIAFDENSPQSIPKSRSELLEVLQQEIEQLNTQRENLQQLFQLNEEYQHLLEELSGHEEELESLRIEELSIYKKLMSSLELLDILGKDLEYKQHVYDREQMHANYEKDRHLLEDGVPCPLCGAIHHPVKEKKGNEQFVDKAREELDGVKGQYNLIYEEHKRLLDRQKILEVRIEQLAGNELKEVSGQVTRQFQRILSYEEKIAQVVPRLTEGGYELTRASLLRLKMQESASKVEAMKEARIRLLQLQTELDSLEKEIALKEEEQKEIQHQIEKREDRCRNFEEQLKDNKLKFKATVITLNKTIKPYGLRFELGEAAQLFEQLQQLNKEYQAKTTQQQFLKGETEKWKIKKEQIDHRLHENKVSLAALKKEIDQIQKEITGIQEERQAVLGVNDPIELEQKLEDQLNSQSQKVSQLQRELAQIDTQLKSLDQQAEGKKERLAGLRLKIDQQEKELIEKVKTKGFADLDSFKAALLSDKESEHLQNLKKNLEQQQLKVGQSLKDCKEELDRLAKLDLPDTPMVELMAKLNEQEESFQLLQQEIGALRERIQQHFKQEKKAGELLDRIESQQAEVTRWAKLNDLIGQADGKKFRIFAQGLTLNKLIFLSNQHLQQLNGRYLIKKSSDQDLELEIVDTYQADNSRSMNTLSGGESFLVSLALALALSDLAGRNARIQSLFIDEGFGTLDDNSLDLAITTLENLQANGKTIGVISHVKALKERISTQIKLVKRGSGFSQLEVTSHG